MSDIWLAWLDDAQDSYVRRVVPRGSQDRDFIRQAILEKADRIWTDHLHKQYWGMRGSHHNQIQDADLTFLFDLNRALNADTLERRVKMQYAMRQLVDGPLRGLRKLADTDAGESDNDNYLRRRSVRYDPDLRPESAFRKVLLARMQQRRIMVDGAG